MKKGITNWGLFPNVLAEEYSFYDNRSLMNILSSGQSFIARGMGRSYGDASLGENIISTLNFNKFLEFNETDGILSCQAGVTLEEILEVIVPRGWFLPVTPGTKKITLGGALAADIHGKNHHKDGTISKHTLEIQVLCGDGKIYTCSDKQNNDLFNATCGGMGLTGIIISARIRLKKIHTSFIRQVQIKARNLEEIFELFSIHRDYTYSVAWIDCLKKGKSLGRSVLMLGEHAEAGEVTKKVKNLFPVHKNPKINIPVYFPSFFLNTYSVRAFNFLVYNKNLSGEKRNIVNYDPFFYPLDVVNNWNKIYGRKGFLQYQFVLPYESSLSGIQRILTEISNKGMGSFLAVLKLFGNESNFLSFPMKGLTLALDFPIKRDIFPFLDYLDQIVLDHGGRIYLAKDARMKADTLMKGYPDLAKFLQTVQKYNPTTKFKSLLSERLKLTNG